MPLLRAASSNVWAVQDQRFGDRLPVSAPLSGAQRGQEIVCGNLNVVQNLPQQRWGYVPAAMMRDRRRAAVDVSIEYMTAFLPRRDEPKSNERPVDVAERNDR